MIWPKTPKPSSILGGMINLATPELSLSLLACAGMAGIVLFGLSGCVSIPTHERMLTERYEDGNYDMGLRCYHDLQTMSKEDVMFVLKSFIGAENLKVRRVKDYANKHRGE